MTRNLVGSGSMRLFAAAAAAAAIAGVLLGYAYAIEPRRLQRRSYRVAVPDLPDELEGLTIAHLTDFHVGMTGTRRSTLRRALRLAADWRPDLVALTGDFVHDGRWLPGAALFRDMAATAPTFAVLGNHDHAATAAATEGIVAALRAQGVTVLRNEHRTVPVRGGRGEVVVVAVDDPSQGRDDLATAMVGLSSEVERRRPTLLLGHAPDVIDRAPPNRFALTLAGHTHGGQLRSSPFKRRTPLDVSMAAGGLDSAYARGTLVVNGNPLFVNSGLGLSGVPFRFLAPPQVARFTLTRLLSEHASADDPERFFLPDSNEG
ncbi:MAG: metallophosphoesterase [Chloroflexota bacterium]|nr:metallophosphoesterase [Chloroflexota bacterium]